MKEYRALASGRSTRRASAGGERTGAAATGRRGWSRGRVRARQWPGGVVTADGVDRVAEQRGEQARLQIKTKKVVNTTAVAMLEEAEKGL